MVMVAFLFAMAAPVLAQQSSAPAAPAAPAQKAPAKTAAKPKTATGVVKSATADSVVLVAGKDKKEWTFGVDKDTKITKAGKAATAADLAADDRATVTYTEADGKMHAKSVTVKAVKTAKTTAKPKS
jgi:hypothetical protein